MAAAPAARTVDLVDDTDDADEDDDDAPIAPIQLRRTPSPIPAAVRAVPQRRDHGRRDESHEDTAVGFGDDVPAFLRR